MVLVRGSFPAEKSYYAASAMSLILPTVHVKSGQKRLFSSSAGRKAKTFKKEPTVALKKDLLAGHQGT